MPKYNKIIDVNNNLDCEEWIENDVLHCEDGPAYIRYYNTGEVWSEDWLVHGELHRLDGPAVIEYYSNGSIMHEAWFVNNKRHRIDGPAMILYEKDHTINSSQWFINDALIEPKPFDNLQLSKEEIVEVKLKYT